jgi:GNAT superfamily N-acetyltransferase
MFKILLKMKSNENLISQISKLRLWYDNNEHIKKLRKFIDENENIFFRYYKKRNFDVLKNHKYTCLYYYNSDCAGYGHLDLESDKIWLGILISTKFQGMGIGSVIMDDLIYNSDKDIHLTVDLNNYNAITLYEKKNFIKIYQNDKFYTLKLKKMADTLGSIIDKLVTVDMKMWDNQELLYEIRRISFDEFKEKYFLTEEGSKILWEILKKACDLNVQRNQLINEVDFKIVEMIQSQQNGEYLDNGKYIQRSFKTY